MLYVFKKKTNKFIGTTNFDMLVDYTKMKEFYHKTTGQLKEEGTLDKYNKELLDMIKNKLNNGGVSKT